MERSDITLNIELYDYNSYLSSSLPLGGLGVGSLFGRVGVGSIHIHLTLTALELQTETPAIIQPQIQRFLPRRLLPTIFHAVTQTVFQTVPTLHDEWILHWRELKGRSNLFQSLLLIECPRLLVGNVEQIRIFVQR